MKKLIKFFIFLVILAIIVLVAAPFLIPIQVVKDFAAQKVKEATGRELIIAGDVSASVFPNIAVSLKNVSLSNPEGFSDKQMAEIGELKLEVALMPLLNKKVEVTRFVVVKPTIHLEVNKNKLANWQFDTASTKTEEAAKTEQKSEAKSSVAHTLPLLANIEIERGNFTYKDQTQGKNYSAKDVDLEIKLPSPSSALSVNAEMLFDNQKIKLALKAEKPLAILSGEESIVDFGASVDSLVTVAFYGKASKNGANGDFAFSSPSLVNLSALSGKKIEWKGATPLAFSVKSSLACSTSECALSKANIALDEMKFSGDLNAKFGGSIPSIEAKLTADTLDFNPYLPKPEKQASLSLISSAYAAEGWSNAKIDLSGLKATNANIALTAKNVIYQKTTLGNMLLNLKLAGGALALDIPQMSLYDGSAKLALTANSANNISAKLNIAGVQIEPLLKDFAEFDRLSGTANIETSISGHGTSQRDIISSLAGSGSVHIADGTIKGVDIGKMVASAKDFVTGANTANEKTSFSELGGTYTIAAGVVKNSDLAMKAPLLRVKGEGTVELPEKQVNYKLTPSVVGNLQGQGGKDTAGVSVPILVTGTFDALSFRPDLASTVQDALKNPEKIKESLKDIKGALKNPDAVKGLLNGLGR